MGGSRAQKCVAGICSLFRTLTLGIVPDLNFQNMGKLIKLKSLFEKTQANIDTKRILSS